MLRKTVLIAIVIVLSLAVALPAFAGGGPPPRDEDGNRIRVVVYVTSQDLYYDSIVGPDLPQRGPFQQLFPPGTNPDWPDGDIISTEFGSGDPGHKGGRWWVDVNGSGEMDEGDHFFSCPLMGPGREAP